MPQHERRKRRHSRGRRPLYERLVRGIRRVLFPQTRGRRGQIIAFAIALVLLLIAAVTVIAVEGGLSSFNPVPAEE